MSLESFKNVGTKGVKKSSIFDINAETVFDIYNH